MGVCTTQWVIWQAANRPAVIDVVTDIEALAPTAVS
jgi:hypothetical protein